MITIHTLREDWEERRNALTKHIEHLEQMARTGNIDSHARTSAELWLDALRRWKREVEVLLRQE